MTMMPRLGRDVPNFAWDYGDSGIWETRRFDSGKTSHRSTTHRRQRNVRWSR